MRKLLLLLFIPLFYACEPSQPNEDVVKQPSKDGSVETTLSVTHQDTYDILTTTHKIWFHNALDKVIVTTDTLKTLGTQIVENDEDGPEDENGDATTVTTKAVIPKNYELYITVK